MGVMSRGTPPERGRVYTRERPSSPVPWLMPTRVPSGESTWSLLQQSAKPVSTGSLSKVSRWNFHSRPPGVVQQGVPAREPVGGFNQVVELFEHLPLPCGRVHGLQKGDGVPLLKGLFFRSHFHDKFLPNRF